MIDASDMPQSAVKARSRAGLGKTVSILRDAVFAVLAVFLTLALLEIGMRAAGVRYQSSFFRTNWDRGYVYRPNAAGWWIGNDRIYTRINSHGQHDREHSFAKPPGVIRIAVVGSSYVSGMQVLPKDNFVYLLERFLNSRANIKQRVETLNFGVDAYSIVQSYYALQEDVWQYHPDIVIFNITNIDLLDTTRDTAWNRWGTYRPFFEIDAKGEVVPDRLSRMRPKLTSAELEAEDRRNELLNRSELALASNSAYYKALARLTPKPIAPDPYTSNPDYQFVLSLSPPPGNGPMEKDWDILEALLPKFKRSAERHGADLWIVSTGIPEQENPDPAFREAFQKKIGVADLYYWDKRVDAIAQADGIHSLRLPPLMADYATKHNVYLHGFFYTPPGTGHWNAKGNEVAAGFIADDLLKSSRFFKNSQRTEP